MTEHVGTRERDALAHAAERIDALEQANRRAYEDAQREADALFAQYQLSQILASGGSPAELGQTALIELTRLAGAAGGAIWLGENDGAELALIAQSGSIDDLPQRLPDADGAQQLSEDRRDLFFVTLADSPPHTLLAFRANNSDELDADGLRIIQLARHEIAVAFAGAHLRDVLERERHELAAVVEGATDIIVQVDTDNLVTRLNPAATRILGRPESELLRLHCADALGCESVGSHTRADCPLARVMRTGEAIDYSETAIRGGQGLALRVAGGYAPAPARYGGSTRATAILRDVTSSRALEELREGFVATVSHELRTPIALVRGYAETLLHFELTPDEARSYLGRIQQVTTRLTALVDQILDVTHMNADPLILERAPASFASIVARLAGDLALTGGADRLVVELPPDLPPIEVDAGRVGQVLENLVSNALKYAAPGSPIIVGAKPDGDWLLAWVDDEGIGIPSNERALVTEPFHRAWNVRESRIAGTGLGLYICRRLVEGHGGRLTIEDRPDGRPGSHISFTLPMLPGRRHRPPSRGASRADATITEAKPSGHLGG